MNPQEPAGGFQQGGWYEGRQYWNGSFSAPGVIHSASPQQGAGQAVSQETVQQTDPKNWEYIQKQQQQQQQQPQQISQPQQPQVQAPQQQKQQIPGEGMEAIPATPPPPPIDLPALYKSLTESSGIGGLEAELSSKTTAYNDAMSKINDNPFLSEANRVGRAQKLTLDFNARITNLQNDIATKKADVEMQLNLQTKQYDIESQAAQMALEKFNVLLSSGALDNISGEDIAGLTRSTGLSSGMIQSAISVNIKKNNPVSIQTYDDGVNQGFVTIDSNGNIVNKSVVGQSQSLVDYQRKKADEAEKEEVKVSGGGGGAVSGGGGGDTKKGQTSDVKYLIELYRNVNKGNPSWQKAHDLREQYSPEDFKSNLLLQFPLARAYINSNLK